MNRSPLYVLLFAALIMLPVGVSAAHHEGPPGDHMPSWTIEEAMQQAQMLPAALRPTFMATLEIERGLREMAGTNPDPAAMQPTFVSLQESIVGTLEQTLGFLDGASPEDAQKVHQVLSFFNQPQPGEPAAPVPPDATALCQMMLAESQAELAAARAGHMPGGPPGGDDAGGVPG